MDIKVFPNGRISAYIVDFGTFQKIKYTKSTLFFYI